MCAPFGGICVATLILLYPLGPGQPLTSSVNFCVLSQTVMSYFHTQPVSDDTVSAAFSCLAKRASDCFWSTTFISRFSKLLLSLSVAVVSVKVPKNKQTDHTVGCSET
ncbi:hypothetical protein BaRGS_00002514 [Batillaria attramentaria]|uniref:Secreted protein n=1 Tax=Batillaria attramentaria TaxID=370345 RepID=A0ABD0M3X4_9CAEN